MGNFSENNSFDANVAEVVDGQPVAAATYNPIFQSVVDRTRWLYNLVTSGKVFSSASADTAATSQNSVTTGGFTPSQTAGASQIPVADANGNLNLNGSINPIIAVKTATASPTTYPAGLSQFAVVGDATWPTSNGLVFTQVSTSCIQYFYANSTTGTAPVYFRSASVNGSTFQWSAWAVLPFSGAPTLSIYNNTVGISIMSNYPGSWTEAVPAGNYLVELDMCGVQNIAADLTVGATVNGTTKYIFPTAVVNYGVAAGGTVRFYLPNVSSITVQPLFTGNTYNQQCDLSIFSVG